MFGPSLSPDQLRRARGSSGQGFSGKQGCIACEADSSAMAICQGSAASVSEQSIRPFSVVSWSAVGVAADFIRVLTMTSFFSISRLPGLYL